MFHRNVMVMARKSNIHPKPHYGLTFYGYTFEENLNFYSIYMIMLRGVYWTLIASTSWVWS